MNNKEILKLTKKISKMSPTVLQKLALKTEPAALKKLYVKELKNRTVKTIEKSVLNYLRYDLNFGAELKNKPSAKGTGFKNSTEYTEFLIDFALSYSKPKPQIVPDIFTSFICRGWDISMQSIAECVNKNGNGNLLAAVYIYDPNDISQQNGPSTEFPEPIIIDITNIKGAKDSLQQIIYAIESSIGEINIKIMLVNKSRASVQYLDSFKTNPDYNCMLNVIKTHAMNTQNYKLSNKIDDLNGKYFKSGVTFENIREISKDIGHRIEIYNKAEDLIFETEKSEIRTHKMVFRFTKTENNHLVGKCVDDFFNMSKKIIIYVEDLEIYYKELKGWKVKVDNPDKTIKYFYNETNIFKLDITQSFDKEKYFINDEQDLANYNFEQENGLSFNSIKKENDPNLFTFIHQANHHLNEVYFPENADQDTITNIEEIDDLDPDVDVINYGTTNINIDLSTTFAYDANKNYAAYKDNKYYEAYQFPKTGKLSFYNVNDDIEVDAIIEKCGYTQVYDINFENSKRILEKIGYLQENGIYFNAILRFFLDNGVTFKVKTTAFTNWKYNINFNDNMIVNKYYNKLIGTFEITSDFRVIKLDCENLEEVQDLLYHSADKVTYFTKNSVYLKIQKKCTIARTHISSAILTYASISIFQKLLLIPEDDIIGIKVDCIICRSNQDHLFELNKNIGGWKRESKSDKVLRGNELLVQEIKPFDFIPDIPLTTVKLQYNKINFITGAAGTGKTTRYAINFGLNDERLYNSAFGFPNNNLKAIFAKDYNVRTETYHNACNINTEGYKSSYSGKDVADLIIDEITMVTLDHIEKIIGYCYDNCVNIHFVGDYDLTKKRMYQLKPPEGTKSIIDLNINKYAGVFMLNLTRNFRQDGDEFYAYKLNQYRGMDMQEVMDDIIKTVPYSRKIQFDTIREHYQDNDIALASTNKLVDSVNLSMNYRDNLQIKYNKTTKQHANNEMAIIKKEDFTKNMDLAFCLTTHLCQGLTYTTKIFIVISQLFDVNMLYVALSRAKKLNQIYLVFI